MPTVHFSIVANRALGGGEEKESRKKRRALAGNYLYSFHLFLCIPAACTLWLHTFTYGNKIQKKFTGLFAPCWPFSEPLGQSGSICRAQHCLKTGVGVESLTLFIAFSSCLVLAHCFCHAHLHLPVVSYPSPFFFYISFTPLLSSPFSERISPCQVLWIPQSFI